MKFIAAVLPLVPLAAAHATFQDLWVGNTDEQAYCVRLPTSNNPVTDVTSNNFRCNINNGNAPHTCAVTAGQQVTVEMHQQPGDRSCSDEAIGGDHYGPISVYMTKVSNALTADGSTGWFKIYEDSWSKGSSGGNGASDNWGTKDLNNCCGRVTVKIPSDIPSGDYLLRAEVLALHVASSVGGAQFYMSCYQLTVSGGGSASPSLVNFPGAYKATDPGILIDIYQTLSTYIVPGPTVYSGGMTKSAGATCSAGPESGKTTGPAFSGGAAPTGSGGNAPSGTSSTLVTSTAAPQTSPTSTAGGSGSCTQTRYGQCGGTGYSGCSNCQSGSTCSGVSPPYYSQCV